MSFLVQFASRLAVPRSALTLSRGLASGKQVVENTTKDNFLEKDMEYTDMHKGKEFGNFGLPDALGYAVGRSRMEKLAILAGNDQFYEDKVYKFFPNSKERPMLVPSHMHYRQVGCPCDETHACYTFLFKNLPNRCYCGNHMKLVSYDDYFMDLRERITACYEAYHKLPAGKRSFKELAEEHQVLVFNYPMVVKPIEEGKLEDALPPKSWKELEDAVGSLRKPLVAVH